MKLKYMMNGGLLAIALALGAASSANAQSSPQYSNGDWLLGFYGGSKTFVIDIGQPSRFGFTLLNSSSHIATDLTSAFGSSWYGNVYYAVISTDASVDSVKVTNPDLGQPGGVFPSANDLSGPSSDIATIGNSVSNQFLGAPPNGFNEASNGVIQTNANSTWNQYVSSSGADAYMDNYFQNYDDSGDGGIGDLTSNPLQFDYMQDSNSATTKVLGTFSIDSAGDVNFAGAVPEPSTFAALGLGAAVLAFARRRRSAAR